MDGVESRLRQYNELDPRTKRFRERLNALSKELLGRERKSGNTVPEPVPLDMNNPKDLDPRSKRFRERLNALGEELLDRKRKSEHIVPESVPLDMNNPKDLGSISGEEFVDELISGNGDRILRQLQEETQIMLKAVKDFKLPEVRTIDFRYWSRESPEQTAPESHLEVNECPSGLPPSVFHRYQKSKAWVKSFLASNKKRRLLADERGSLTPPRNSFESWPDADGGSPTPPGYTFESLAEGDGGSPTPPRYPFESLAEEDGGLPRRNPLEALQLKSLSTSHPDQSSSLKEADCQLKDPIAVTSVSQNVNSYECTEISTCTRGYPETHDDSTAGIHNAGFEQADELSFSKTNESEPQSLAHESKQPEVKVPKRKQQKKPRSMRQSLAGLGTSMTDGVRRSTRIRSRPLEYWKGERFLYGRIHKSLVTVIGVKKYDSPQVGKRNLKVKSFVDEEFQNLVELAALD